MISLLAGKPNASTFPFTSLSFNARSPSDPDSETTLTIDGAELTQGLQYGDTTGLKGLLDWLHGLQELSHGRKREEGWRIAMGAGSQDLIYKVCHTIRCSSLYLRCPTGSSCHGEPRGCCLCRVSSLCVSNHRNVLRKYILIWTCRGVIPMFSTMGCKQIGIYHTFYDLASMMFMHP